MFNVKLFFFLLIASKENETNITDTVKKIQKKFNLHYISRSTEAISVSTRDLTEDYFLFLLTLKIWISFLRSPRT